MPNDTTSLDEISRSVSRWYSQMSFAHVNVPRFNSCSNVYDFLTEYEDATITLEDEQKASLLNRAFPPGCHRSWYENELKPLIDASKPWKDIKTKIIGRFSMQEDQDRHLARLRELKFNPEGNKMLLDFVDDMIYSHKRAYPTDTSKESCVRWIKSALPQNIQAILSVNPDYQSNTDIEKLKKAVRQYDMSKSNDVGRPLDRHLTTEMANMVKDLVATVRSELELCKKDNEATRKDNEATRGAVVAAFQSNQASRTYGDSYRNRQRSPARYNDRRSPSPGPPRGPPSPRLREGSYNSGWRQEPKTSFNKEQIYIKPDSTPAKMPENAFNSKSYFERFGAPPTPCPECNEDLWHWARHCHKRLN